MAEKKINGRLFKTEPLLATQSMLLKARLLKILGPAVPKLVEAFQARVEDKSAEGEQRSNLAALAAFSEIFTGVEPEVLAGLVKDICEIAQIRRDNGQYFPLDFDGDMTGHDGDVPALVIWVLTEQFGSFFKGLPAFGTRSRMVPN
jgi:hypothetical protein